MPESRTSIRVSFYVFFPRGGIGRYTDELVRALNNDECMAETVCTPDYDWQTHAEYPVWPGLKTISHPVPLRRRVRFLTSQFINPVRFIRHAEKSGADILHFSNINHLSYPYWRRQLRMSGLPVAVSVHDVRRQKGIIHHGYEAKQLAQFYRDADVLFVHSGVQKTELVSFSGVDPGAVRIVPHGPYPHAASSTGRNEIRARLGVEPEEQLALFFGSIRDEKNLDGFMEAMAICDDPFQLVVAGQTATRHRDVSWYESLAEKLGIRNRIQFIHRYVRDEEVSELFNAADWIPLPYNDSFTSQSGVLNVAASYGRPVLVSSSPVLKETVERCEIGDICKSASVEDLSDGISRIVSKVRNGHDFAFKEYQSWFSWAENARITIEAYRSILKR